MPSFYKHAQEVYASFGVDTEAALRILSSTSISIHCWQGDDVAGLESNAGLTCGGIQVTGNYPGRARSASELRLDLEKALSLIPGRHRLNLHASYADVPGKSVERNAYTVEHFQSWIDWAKVNGLGLDFNPTYFSHPLANEGATLSHRDSGIRQFWIDHGIACRRIAVEMGRQLDGRTITNFWIPDGSKDIPVDRKGPRERLASSLDAIFADQVPAQFNLDSVESKLFGIGSESYVVGSHEFYLAYSVRRGINVCLDAGHFHPTENLADKISSVLQFTPELLLHVSRGVRWDSDHVVLFDDATRGIMEELVRGDFLSRTHIGLDFFDASINRLVAWVSGTRNTQKALLAALLDPLNLLRDVENARDYGSRLALLEEAKTLPLGAVWEEFCGREDVPSGATWLKDIKMYEESVLARR